MTQYFTPLETLLRDNETRKLLGNPAPGAKYELTAYVKVTGDTDGVHWVNGSASSYKLHTPEQVLDTTSQTNVSLPHNATDGTIWLPPTCRKGSL